MQIQALKTNCRDTRDSCGNSRVGVNMSGWIVGRLKHFRQTAIYLSAPPITSTCVSWPSRRVKDASWQQCIQTAFSLTTLSASGIRLRTSPNAYSTVAKEVKHKNIGLPQPNRCPHKAQIPVDQPNTNQLQRKQVQ